MTDRLRVETSELKKLDKEIRDCTSRYKSAYEKMYRAVSEMGTMWNDDANRVFTREIEEFRPEFKKMEDCMNNFAEHSRRSGERFIETQRRIIEDLKRKRR